MGAVRTLKLSRQRIAVSNILYLFFLYLKKYGVAIWLDRSYENTQRSIFRSENDIYFPLSENDIFPLSRDMSFSTPIVAFLP